MLVNSYNSVVGHRYIVLYESQNWFCNKQFTLEFSFRFIIYTSQSLPLSAYEKPQKLFQYLRIWRSIYSTCTNYDQKSNINNSRYSHIWHAFHEAFIEQYDVQVHYFDVGNIQMPQIPHRY